MSKKLSELADIFISSVDKKIREGEQEVLLCNFTDVYKNWAITERNREKFLTATAKLKEIETFCLKKGQVAITKDSETKFDIGESSYIADDFENVILGYHTVLIKPFEELLDGKYLNAYFKTNMMKRYFENNATGSGQRYTLPIDVLNDIPIALPKLDYQKRIGYFFSYLDRKFELNKKINDNLPCYSMVA
ncbi:restriction endonuclease subunit S [Fusobacterium sp.]|uniref:restriction endonuclease subunit S n=1 Tax=Fusobacterium sp. TaxID=68766 RepID=UPI0025B95932|nr:restriction endonuclease subunit S [Fusobacterium sp.]MCI5725872.1 restriction endonuclease subunit S [Fusobacterium sp.]